MSPRLKILPVPAKVCSIVSGGNYACGVAQENRYYPYGLPISGGVNTQYTPYLFGSKEFEDRQGLNIYDFGARTYVPDECRFWQPDPKAHDYHWLSPYAYCGGDPINFIDPTGEKIYYVDMAGRLITSEEVLNKISNRPEYEAALEGLDRVVIIDQDGKIISESDTFEEGTIDATLSIPTDLPFCGGFKSVFTLFTVHGDDNSKSLFQFLSDNITATSGIEFGLNLMGASANGSINDLFTGHTPHRLTNFNYIFVPRLLMKRTFREFYHSHSKNIRPSNADYIFAESTSNILFNTQNTIPVYKLYVAKSKQTRVYTVPPK